MPCMLDGLTPQEITVYKALPESVRRAMTEKLRYNCNVRRDFGEKIHVYHTRPKSQIKDVTWEEESESLKRCIIGSLWNGKQPDRQGQPWIPEEQAKIIRERLLNEIPTEGFLEIGGGDFGYVHKYYANLQDGDLLLIR